MYPWWIYLLPALITGIIAIVVQIVAARYTAKREQIRLNFERDRWEFEKAQAQRSLMFSAKQQAFARFVSDYHDVKNTLWNYIFRRGNDGAGEIMNALDAIMLACDGLAIFDEKAADMSHALVYRLRNVGIDNLDEYESKMEPLNDSFAEIVKYMRGSLPALELPDLNSHNQPQLNEAPMSGKSESKKTSLEKVDGS